jgi:hypothetical protein
MNNARLKAPEKRKRERKNRQEERKKKRNHQDRAGQIQLSYALCSLEHIPPASCPFVCSRSIDKRHCSFNFRSGDRTTHDYPRGLTRTTYALHSAQWRIFLQPFARCSICRAQREFDALVCDARDFLRRSSISFASWFAET